MTRRELKEILEGIFVLALLLGLAFLLTLGFKEMLGGNRPQECSCEMMKNKECNKP